MRLHLLAACTATLLLAIAPAAQAAALDDLLAQAQRGTRVPALAALEMRDGHVVAEAVRGVRRNDRPEPVRADDPWLIGSDGKPMTAALIARLVDRGLLQWDTPLATLVPALGDTLRAEYRSVTLAQLLSHRAGLPENIADEKVVMAFHTDPRALPAQRLAYVVQALQEAPVNVPGTAVSYSNTGFMLAAVVAELRTGTSYEELMRREVFGPLGMDHVGFGIPHEGQPVGHHDGAPALQVDDSNPPMFAPAGNLHMPLRDWARFCLDQLAGAQGRGTLLKPESYLRMQTAGPDRGAVGWGVQPSISGRAGPVLVHAGSDGNWYALVMLFPVTQRGFLLVANAGPDMGADQALRQVFEALN